MKLKLTQLEVRSNICNVKCRIISSMRLSKISMKPTKTKPCIKLQLPQLKVVR